MKKILLITIIVLFQNFLFSQTKSIEKRIADNAIKLEKSDYSFLDKIVKDKRLITLGEAGHDEESTFVVKTEMISYLHDKLGFEVLGLEAASFINLSMANSLDSLGYGRWDFDNVWAPVWSDSKSCIPIMNMIREKKIQAFGFDIGGLWEITSLKKILERNNLTLPDYIDWKRVQDICYKFTFLKKIPDKDLLKQEDDLYFISFLNTLKNNIDYWNTIYKFSDMDLLKQVWLNLRSEHRERKLALNYGYDDDWTAIGNNIRDEQMARNILWYMKNNPKKKIIIWCANFHGAKAISNAEFKRKYDMYSYNTLMGEVLYETLGNKMYSLAISRPYSKEYSGENALEIELLNRGYNYSFIDYSKIRNKKEFVDVEFRSTVIGPKQGRWLNVFDGLYVYNN